jgi:hypothetical protein
MGLTWLYAQLHHLLISSGMWCVRAGGRSDGQTSFWGGRLERGEDWFLFFGCDRNGEKTEQVFCGSGGAEVRC